MRHVVAVSVAHVEVCVSVSLFDGDPFVLQSAVQSVPHPVWHVGVGAPDVNVVVGLFLFGGQSIEKISNSLKHGGEGMGGNEGNLGIGKGLIVGSGTGDQ